MDSSTNIILSKKQSLKNDKWFSGSPAKESACNLISGMTSGFFCKIFEYPFDTVKVLMQTQRDVTRGTMETVLTTYRQGGMRALYQGLTSPLVGAMIENATLFVAYGAIKNQLGVDPHPSLSNPVPFWKYAASGAGSGLFSAMVLTPVELIKCRLQVQQGPGPRLYSGPIDALVKLVRQEGIFGLWKGNVSCLAREIPGNVAWFGTYEYVKGSIQRHYKYEYAEEIPLQWIALSGSCAGVMYWAVPFPADTIKSRIQTDPAFAKLSIPQAFNRIVKVEGFGSLYRGLGVTCMRAIPSHALIFYFYELASEFLGKY